MPTRNDKISLVRAVLGADVDAQRRARARTLAASIEPIDVAVRAGESIKDAAKRLLPDEPYASVKSRLQTWRTEGEDGFYDTRLPPRRSDLPADLHDQIVAYGRVFPDLPAEMIAQRMVEAGILVSTSTVTGHLRHAGLARAVGRPLGARTGGRPRGEGARPVPPAARIERQHPLAGAELLAALDEIDGASLAMARAVVAHARTLPVPGTLAVEPPNSRDERGRFKAAYNAPEPRRFAKMNAKFESVRLKRLTKDPSTFAFLSTSEEAVHFKMRAMTFLPLVAERGRFAELQHGLDERLGVLVRRPYRAATLEKFAREMKYAGSGSALQQTWMTHVRCRDGEAVDAQTGAIVLYGDGTTHPHWTHVYERSTRVSKRGKIMPGVTTLTLHTGVGTPIHYVAVSGGASLPELIPSMLKSYEDDAGPGTATRIVVMDRESHAVGLFKALRDRWHYIVPLRSNVTGANASFEGLSAWSAWGDHGEVCDGHLTLRDRRAGQKDLKVRVVGFRRRPEGSVMWFATNCPDAPFTAAHVTRLYFARWPYQERQYRDAAGAVALHRQHGYGKEEVDNIAVVTRLDAVTLKMETLEDEAHDLTCEMTWVVAHVRTLTQAAEAADRAEVLAEAELARTVEHAPHEAHAAHKAWLAAKEAASKGHKQVEAYESHFARLELLHARVEGQLSKLRDESVELLDRQKIFRLDTDLDEVMLAPKCCFIRLCAMLQKLMGTKMEIRTLISRVLTLPGRVREAPDGTNRQVTLYRNPHDPELDGPLGVAVAEVNRQLGTERIVLSDRPEGAIR